MPSVLDSVRDRLVEHLQVESESVRPEARLREDLGLHSIAALELIIDLEEAYDLSFEDEQLEELSTVADVVRAVESRLAPESG